MHSTVGLGGLACASTTVNCIMLLLWCNRRILHETPTTSGQDHRHRLRHRRDDLFPDRPRYPLKMTWISKSVTVVGGILLAHA